MRKRQRFQQMPIYYTAMALLLSIIIFPSCTHLSQSSRGRRVPIAETEWSMWNLGMRAFQKGDYKDAAKVFEDLSQAAQSKEMNRKALYALACTRLILAGNPDEFDKALELWNRWSQLVPEESQDEDPRMMNSLLHRLHLAETHEGLYKEDKKSCEDTACRNALWKKEKEVEKLKQKVKILEAKDRKSPKRTGRKSNQKSRYDELLEAKEKEIQVLKQQIESLEAIHQEIQDKKKQATSP